MTDTLLSIQDLKVDFDTYEGVVKTLDGVTFSILEGEIFGLVGETGCGKTITALSIIRLVPENGRITQGKILFRNEDLLRKTEEEMRKLRGGKISMIFQDPSISLNPVFTVGEQLTDIISVHQNLEKDEAVKKAVESFDLVALSDPEKTMKQYPHELSGGMQQRVMIAMALSSDPDMLIADEPTSSVDVTIQAQLLKRLLQIKSARNLAILLITHSMGIVAETCDKVGVMYAGNIVEIGPMRGTLKKPLHPYTQGLLASIPKPETRRSKLQLVKGSIPDLINRPQGCAFHPRCPYAIDRCKAEKPELIEISPGRYAACHLVER
ncbi:MAG: ABC transporter ATP-binding protein [Candidatus Bathyarchaeia archaeon]